MGQKQGVNDETRKNTKRGNVKSLSWHKYFKQNKSEGDCQLVTAINAHYYLTGNLYCKQDSKEYNRLIELTGCRFGSATNIEKAYEELGIEVIWEGISLTELSQVTQTEKIQLPLEWNVWAWGCGFHSALIVDQVKKCNCIRVTNFKQGTQTDGWMSYWDMYKYENYSVQRDLKLFRLFALKGNLNNRKIKKLWKKEQKRWFEMHKSIYSKKLKEMK